MELMVTVAMVSILAMASVPSFMGLIQSRQVSSTTTELISYLSLARQEAIGRNHSIALQGLNADDADSLEWNAGFQVAIDANNDNAFDADGEVILISEPKNSVKITSNQGQAGFKFLASGLSSSNDEVTFTVCAGTGGASGKLVTVLKSGQITQKDETCGEETSA